MDFLQPFVLAFIPLFVAIDALGILPLYLSMTETLDLAPRRRLLRQAVVTAGVIAVAFVYGGKLLFQVMGITEHDFRIAGGILLLIMSTTDLLFSQPERRRKPDSTLGIVPLGTPLIIGPAALATLLICVDNHGYLVTIAALAANLAIAWAVLHYSDHLLRLLGAPVTRACSKVASLLLAAIGVMMIRLGVLGIIAAAP
jgi:multiple antibiotic resistance protein